MVAVIDYGLGNVKAIANMLQRIGCQTVIVSDASELRSADRIILPGVGSFDEAMVRLAERGYVRALREAVVQHGTPILGICLGMQLLTSKSEEGRLPGFGWLDAQTERFRFAPAARHLKTPHMGWNRVTVLRESGLFRNGGEQPRFYFAHSYHVTCNRTEDVVAVTRYGQDFAATVQRENVFGVQFHPEKSHRYGMAILAEFLNV